MDEHKVGSMAKDLRSSKRKMLSVLQETLELSSFHSRVNRPFLCDNEFVSGLLHIIKKNSLGEPPITALKILTNLSVEKELRITLAQYEVIPALLSDVKSRLPLVDERCSEAIKCLTNLSIEPNNQPIIVENDAIPILLRVIRIDKTEESRKWAIWVLTNLSVRDEYANKIIELGVVNEIAGVIKQKYKADEPTSRGLDLIRNVSKHRYAAVEVVNSGVLDDIISIVKQSTSIKSGSTPEQAALLVLLRLSQHQLTALELIAKGVPEFVSTLVSRNDFIGVIAFMIVLLLCYDEETGKYDSLLVAASGLTKQIIQFFHATLNEEGVENLFYFGVFSVDLVILVLRRLASIGSNIHNMISANFIHDLVLVACDQEVLFTQMIKDCSLHILLALSSNNQAKHYMIAESYFINILNEKANYRDSEDSVIALELLNSLTNKKIPKYLFFDCRLTTTRVSIFVGMRNNIEVPLIQPRHEIKSFTKITSQTDLQDYIDYIYSESPDFVVIGIVGQLTFPGNDFESSITEIIEFLKKQIPKKVILEIVKINPEQEILCETAAVNLCSKWSNQDPPDLIVGSVVDCLYLSFQGKYYTFTKPTFQQAFDKIVQHKAEGVFEVEDIWNQQVVLFREKYVDYRPISGSVVALGECAFGAFMLGILLQKNVVGVAAVSRFADEMERQLNELGVKNTISVEDATLLSSTIAQLSVFDGLVDQSANIRFIEEWKLNDNILYPDWLLGWFFFSLDEKK